MSLLLWGLGRAVLVPCVGCGMISVITVDGMLGWCETWGKVCSWEVHVVVGEGGSGLSLGGFSVAL